MRNDLKLVLYLTIMIGTTGLLCPRTFALQPVESLILGNFSEKYSENGSDPLEFVFNHDQSIQSTNLEQYKNDLALYRGFYEEGKNLVNQCSKKFAIKYTKDWDRQQAIRTIISELQYIGLDLTTRAIPQYAKYFDFNAEEYSNLVENLIGNYCSNNLTVISKKELKNNLLLKFKNESGFNLPSVKNNPLFPDNMDKYSPEKKSREQEFKITVKLFQNFCSWTGDINNTGLLVPLLRHGAVMAFINRQLNGKEIEWTAKKNSLAVVNSKKTIQLSCTNLICRKSSSDKFFTNIVLSNGGTNFYDDFQNLYCDYFQILDYVSKGNDPRIQTEIKKISFDDENLLISQFIALITGYPDFLLGLEKYKDGEDLLRSSVDFTWNKWAKSQTENLTRELYFEEPLTLELIDRKLVFNKNDKNLKIGFDVNLGEFDRINQQIGKIKVVFKVAVANSFLKYVRTTIQNMDLSKFSEKNDLLNKFKAQIDKSISVARDRLIIPPWKGDLALLIASEITEEILLVNESFFAENNSGMSNVVVEINYSPFALKYLNHQFNIYEKENLKKSIRSH